MAETNEQTEKIPTPPGKTPDELLDNLIDVLIHHRYDTPEWLDLVAQRHTGAGTPRGKINKIIRLGAYAGVEEAAMRRIVARVAEADKLEEDMSKVGPLITAIYQDYHNWLEREHGTKRN